MDETADIDISATYILERSKHGLMDFYTSSGRPIEHLISTRLDDGCCESVDKWGLCTMPSNTSSLHTTTIIDGTYITFLSLFPHPLLN